MDLSGIISIAGMSGLYKVIAQTKSGLVVESLLDKKRVPAYSTSKVSALEEVSIYSTGDDVPLKDVLKKIHTKEKGATSIDHKAPDAELKKYFKSVFPEYDEARVYVSDIKKVISWYNALEKEGLLTKKEEKKTEDDKPKIKADAKGAIKTKAKDTNAKPVKTASSKVKTPGVRKTGVA
ncbi:MAG TPA: DUF5606 domain-containing protein [Bacteroidia bacterium]|jgi:hypothetical protein|nr:DUF5606 domain-containing protein [Bacteroidia bacterium]HRG52953.1 DUF5606 domain-containing protein [Bacteroidia bacterium]